MSLERFTPYRLRFRRYAPVLTRVFEEWGLPGPWGLAIARQESGFRASAVNQGPGDLRRGGAWGLCQMTLLTAQGLGFLGSAYGLLDPEKNANLAAQFICQLRDRYGLVLKECAAAYNSGKPFDRAPASTREVYVPRVLEFAREYGWTGG